MKKRCGLVVSSALMAAVVVGVLGTGAEGATWTGAGGTNNWSLAANWGGTAPLNNGTDNTHFAGVTRLAPNVDAAWNIGSLTFDFGAGAFVIGGSTLTIQSSAAIANNTSSLETINNTLSLASTAATISAVSGNIALGGAVSEQLSNGALTVTGSFNTTIGGALSGSGMSLVKNGSGTLFFTGVGSTYSGSVQVNNGTLDLNTNGFAMQNASGLFIGDGSGVVGSAIVQEEQGNEFTNTLNMGVTINSDGLLNVKTFGEFAGLLVMTGGSVTGTGGGVLTLTGVGLLSTNASSQTATISSMLGLNATNHSFSIATGATASGIDLDISGVITNGGITKGGTGTLRLSGANVFAGGLTVATGTVLVGVDSVGAVGSVTSGAAGTGPLTLSGGAIGADGAAHTLLNGTTVNGDITVVGSQTLNFSAVTTLVGNRQVTVNGGATVNFNGGVGQDVVGNLLTVHGGGTFGLAGASAFNGTVFIGGGNLVMASGSIFPTITDDEGSITVSGTGQYSVSNNMSVGLGATGLVTQTGGVVTVGTVLDLGDGGSLSQGTYLLSATTGVGQLTSGSEYVGNNGIGIFTQTGGINAIVAGNQLYVGFIAGSTGTYNLSGGVVNAPNEFVGNGASTVNAAKFLQTGGSNNVASVLSVATNVGSFGSYTIDSSVSASTLNAVALRVGDGGTGTFTQNGGNVTVSGGVMTVGRLSGSVGVYNLNSGNLTAGVGPSQANVFIGGAGTGTMNQTGGTFTMAGGPLASLSVGALGGNGTYNMMGGSLVTQSLQAGNGGTGAFVQTGGTVSAVLLNVSTTGASNGNYTLSGTGSVTLNVSNFEAIGASGGGTFTQNGGIHTLGGDIQLGQFAGSAGTYVLNGGTFAIAGNIGDGQSGSGLIIQNAGLLNVTNGFYIGSATGSTGVYVIGNGAAFVGTMFVGNSGGGTVFHNGGTVNVGTWFVGTQFTMAAGTGVYNQTSGALNISSVGYIGIGSAVSAYSLSGTGVLNAPNSPNTFNDLFVGSVGTFNMSGGTENGYVFNSGAFNFSGGTFNGTLENGANGTATFTSFVYFGAGLKNHGALNINGGQVGTATGQTFSNDGVVTLSASGQIYSNGPVVNNGLITGTGSIGGSSTFVNNLSIVQGAGPLTITFGAGSATNVGTITLASGRALNLYGGILNQGDFEVNGASILQNGVLTNGFSGTVVGPGTILAGFANSGLVTPGSGTLNVGSAWINSGVVELSGITSSVTGGAITNTGTIQGFGSVGAAVANSSGTIEAIGGTLVMRGVVTNGAGGTIAAGTGNKILVTGGLATNAGLINLVGGTFDNGGVAMNNTGQISGFGVLRTGGLTNNGNMTFSGTNGSTTTINGSVTNNGGQTINVKFNPAIFTGNFTNNALGTVKITNTTVTYGAAFSNSGNYTSDPATNIFQSGSVNSGSMSGGVGDVFNFAGGVVSNSGTFENGGTLQSSVNIVNTGSFTQSGPQSWGSGTTFTNNGGTASFGSDAGSAGASPLSVVVNAGGVSFASNEHLGSLSVQGGAVTILSGTVKTSSLSFGGSAGALVGEVDLTSAKLVVENTADHAGAVALVKDEVAYGRTHDAGIVSSALAANKTLVVSDNAVAGLTSFGGVSVDAGSILEMAAYKGDYNLDGVVDIKDLQIVANHWQGAATDWSQGDFDGNGVVNIVDLQTLANDWQAGVGSGGGSGEMSFSEALAVMPAFGGVAAAVPEPMSAGVLAVGIGVLMVRRRKA